VYRVFGNRCAQCRADILDEPQHFAVDDAMRRTTQQLRMRDRVEVLRQIGVHDIGVAPAQKPVHFLLAPEWSEHLSDYYIRHVWSCETCGYQFEDTVCLSVRELTDAD
jgi:hypothetical protein